MIKEIFNNGKLIENNFVSKKLLYLIIVLTFIFSPFIQALALSGLINSTVQNMNSGQTSSSTSTASHPTTTSTNSSSGGSLINQINTTVQNPSSATWQTSSTSGGSLINQINSTVQNMNSGYYSSGSSSSSSSNSGSSSSYLPGIPACPFSSNSDRYVVNLGQTLLANSNLSASQFSVNTNLPAGRYNIRVFTWDAHSVHGGQNQNNEQAVLRLLNSSGSTLHTTNRTQDIPNNVDSIISTVSSGVWINENIREIYVYHPEYFSSSPESVTPVCVEFQRIYSYVPPTVPPPVYNNLNVQCDLSRSTINVGDRLEIDAYVSGGTSPYYFDWSGDTRYVSGFNLTRQSQSVRINDSGTYQFRIDVEDRYGNRGSDTCTVRVIGGTYARDINVYSGTNVPPTGEYAGLSSVYLNQVPYTGAEDVAKVAGFISFVLIWSAAIAYYFMKDKKKKDISKKISDFKELNKAKVLAN